MPRLTQQPVVTTTVTEEVTLTARQQKRLLLNLAEYATLEAEIHDKKEELAALSEVIEGLRDEVGAKKVSIEGFDVTRVGGESTYLDKTYMVRKGWVTLSQLEEATKKKPKKASTRITTPAMKKRRKATDEDTDE